MDRDKATVDELRDLVRRLEHQLSLTKYELDKCRGELEALRLGISRRGLTAVELMRRDWDRRARDDARYFTRTDLLDQTDDEFERSGLADVQYTITPDLQEICRGLQPKEMRVLEIGCGPARITTHLATIFGEVHAVDVSQEMIKFARKRAKGIDNLHLHVNSGKDLSLFPDDFFDFVYSYLVFQHIPEKVIIVSYLMETARVLKPEMVFKFQVQGYVGREYVNAPRDTWLGVSFSDKEITQMCKQEGFRVVRITGAGSQYMWVTLLNLKKNV